MAPTPTINPVFVSHTSKMADHARRAIDAVLQAGQLPRDMQFFTASSETPADVCIRAVQQCSVYVGVFGHDFGSLVVDQPGISYTQLEFRTAIEQRKRGLPMQIFVFVLERDTADADQRRFLDEVRNSGITVKPFRDPDQLHGLVLATLVKELPTLRSDRPQQHREYLTHTFTGRVEEIEQILAEIQAGATQLGFVSALKGTGGVGKTTLAAIVAERLNHPLRLPAGILWTNLHAELPGNAARRWLRDLGQPVAGEMSEDDLLAKFRDLAANRPGLLIVLDNAQPPTMGVRDADKLLVKAPGVITLITTRFQEALPRGVQPRNIEELTPADAEALLRRLIGREFDRHPDAAREVIQHSGRLPLLLNPTYDVVINEGVPLPEYAKELRENALRGIGRHDPQVAAVFEISWKHLKALHRELFAVLAWAPGETVGVNLARAWLRLYHPKALAETPHLAEQTLKKLDNASMLIPVGDRYRYHDRARDYARLQVEKMEAKVKERLLHCWCDWDFVKAEFDAIGAFGLADQYRVLHAWGVTEPAEFSPWYHFVRRDATFFDLAKETFLPMATREPKNSPVALAALPIFQREHTHWVEWRNRSKKFLPPACLQILLGHARHVTAVSVTADGRLAISGSADKTVRVWDLERGTPGPVFLGHTGVVRAVGVDEAGQRAVSGSVDRSIRVWDLSRGLPGPILIGHTNVVTGVILTADGSRVVSCSLDGTVRTWNPGGGEPTLVLKGHTKGVNAVCVTPDGGRAVSASNDRTIRIWDLKGGTAGSVLTGHASAVRVVTISADGKRVISASDDQTIRLWDLTHDQPTYVLLYWPRRADFRQNVNAASIFADGGYMVSATWDNMLRVWNLSRRKVCAHLLGHQDPVNAVSVTPDGHCAVSGSDDNTVRIWDLQCARFSEASPGHKRRVTRVRIAMDGRRAVSVSYDKIMQVWDIDDGRCTAVLRGHTASVLALSLTADGDMAISGSEDGTIRVWDLEQGLPGQVLLGHSGAVNMVSVSANGHRVVSASRDHTMRVWDLERGEAKPAIQGHSDRVNAVSITPDGRFAISGSNDATLRLWDIDSGACGLVLVGHTNWVTSVSIKSDGRLAASISRDQTVRLWDLENGRCLATYPKDTREARQAWYMTEPQRRVWLFHEGHFLVYRSAPSDDILARFPGSFEAFACGLDGVNALAFDDAHQPYFLRLHRGNA